jgi:hypothetical protein
VTKLLMTVPSCAWATSCTEVGPELPELLTVVPLGDDRVIEVIGADTTRNATVAVLPELLTVTATGEVLAPTASIKQLALATVASGFTTLVLALLHVVLLECVTSPPVFPFTSVAVTVNCWHGTLQLLRDGVVPRASNAEVGLTVILPTEPGETKKPLQPSMANAIPTSPHVAMSTILLFLMNRSPKIRLYL